MVVEEKEEEVCFDRRLVMKNASKLSKARDMK